jgi:hypothetical protein
MIAEVKMGLCASVFEKIWKAFRTAVGLPPHGHYGYCVVFPQLDEEDNPTFPYFVTGRTLDLVYERNVPSTVGVPGRVETTGNCFALRLH